MTDAEFTVVCGPRPKPPKPTLHPFLIWLRITILVIAAPWALWLLLLLLGRPLGLM